jgi:hypothetical protein
VQDIRILGKELEERTMQLLAARPFAATPVDSIAEPNLPGLANACVPLEESCTDGIPTFDVRNHQLLETNEPSTHISIPPPDLGTVVIASVRDGNVNAKREVPVQVRDEKRDALLIEVPTNDLKEGAAPPPRIRKGQHDCIIPEEYG